MCTNFIIEAVDGAKVVGRSMENGVDFHSELVVRGRGQRIVSPAPSVEDGGMSWTTTYSYVGLNQRGSDWVTDGMNEKGLSLGILSMPGTEYQRVISAPQALVWYWLCDWVLGNFTTVHEVKRSIEGVQVWGSSSRGEAEQPYHFFRDDGGSFRDDGAVVPRKLIQSLEPPARATSRTAGAPF
jgi:choloylglycine hydrolase